MDGRPWCGNGDPWTARTGCGCVERFRGCIRIRIPLDQARWRTGNSRRTSSRMQVAHIRLPQQQRPQRRSKPESKIFHFGFQY